VVEHRGGPHLVLAGPGTGKTTTLVEAVVHRVENDGLDPESVLVLTFSRRAAQELRDRIARRLARTLREPLARTFHSYAFGLLRREAVEAGDPVPRLLAGAEQDVLIRELLRGDVEELGAGYWPDRLRPALLTRGFATELRDLLMRAAERGLEPHHLSALGRRHGRDDWIAAGLFAAQYAGVTALRRPPSYDQAELVRAAAGQLRDDPALLHRERAARAFVVVDEYQDSDPAQEDLLQLLVGGGRDVLVVGDPDQSIYGFRGAEPDAIRNFRERFRRADGAPASVSALEVSRRSGPALVAASRRVAARLGGPRAQRMIRAADPDAPGGASVHVLASSSQEAAFIAARLRAAHLMDEVPWHAMAVLVRSAAAIPLLRRSLSTAGIPVTVRLEEIPLVDQPPVRALLRVLEVVAGRRGLDTDLAFDLVTGPLGGADALALRRLRQELRVHERAVGGTRASGELLVEALADPSALIPLDASSVAPAARVARLLAAGRAAAAAPGATAEDVLWAVWSGSGLAERWTRTALGGGPATAGADRDLDSVVALFDTVARFVDRMPGAGPAGFVEHLRDQQLPADVHVGVAPARHAVSVMTAHAAKGLEWDVVAVAGVNEGVWPDIRERGSLLGTERLVELLAERDDHAVTRASARLAEERRLFYVAVTRARQRLYVTSVSDDDSQPSRFLDDLDPEAGTSTPDRPVEQPGRGLDLASVVAELRSVACDLGQPDDRRRGAAAQLARLAAAGVRQADPDSWYGLGPLSIADPLVPSGDQVRVSPSKVEEFNRCELRWLLKACGATDTDMSRAGIGSLVHDLAERATREQWPDDVLLAELDRAWPGIDSGTGWSAAREYDRVRDMVLRLGRWLRSDPRTLVGVEVDFDVEVGSAYHLAVEHGAFDAAAGGERRSGGAMLVQLGKPNATEAAEQVQPSLADAPDPRWARDLLDRTAEGMRRPVFRAQRGPWCGFCPARVSCPAHPDGGQVTP
jgi:superfamily I DNA/RNA helicase